MKGHDGRFDPGAVIDVMSRGATLHSEQHRNSTRWFLSTGIEVRPDVAAAVTADQRVIGVGDTLFCDLPHQTYRYTGE